MSDWRHSICVSCWKLRNGEREPVRLKDPETELCCYCGNLTSSGIYVRGDPKDTPCKGDHGPSTPEIEQFLREYDEGKHQLPPEVEAALKRSQEEFIRKLKLGEFKIGGENASS